MVPVNGEYWKTPDRARGCCGGVHRCRRLAAVSGVPGSMPARRLRVPSRRDSSSRRHVLPPVPGSRGSGVTEPTPGFRASRHTPSGRRGAPSCQSPSPIAGGSTGHFEDGGRGESSSEIVPLPTCAADGRCAATGSLAALTPVNGELPFHITCQDRRKAPPGCVG